MTETTAHVAGASWDCLGCGERWPCGPARKRLAAEGGDLATLSILMWTYFDDYVREIGPGPLVESYGQFMEAYGRFLGWVREAL